MSALDLLLILLAAVGLRYPLFAIAAGLGFLAIAAHEIRD